MLLSLWLRHTTLNLDAALRDALHGRIEARLSAIARLGAAEQPRRAQAASRLLQVLNDEEPRVREAAAIALGDLGARQALRALLQRCRDDSSARARQGAVVGLSKLGQPTDEGLAAALASACSDESADVRFHAVAALALAVPSAAPPLLLARLEDEDAEVRGSAAAALGDLAHRDSADAIAATVLADPDRSTRIEAAVSLARLGDPRGIEVLAEHLGHREFGPLVAEQLYRHPVPRVEQVLLLQLRRRLGDPLVRVWSAGALCRLGRQDVGRPALTSALQSHKPPVCGLAIEVLGQLDEAWAREALEQLAATPAGAAWSDEIAAALDGEDSD